ncbi:MAG: ankyrin repeat domain-containing protein [Micropepsaceae bacterium]
MDPYASVMSAIAANDEDAALAAIAARDAEAPGRPAGSPLLQALYRGMARVAPALMAAGYAPDLTEAAALGDSERVAALIAAGAEPSALGHDGWTALHLAAFMGHAATVRVLLAAGADIAAIGGNRQANQPLHAAIAGRGDAGAIAALLGAGADVTYAAAGGVTPLHLAASRGNAGLGQTLIAAGADKAALTADGKTAAAIAAERGFAALAEVLV